MTRENEKVFNKINESVSKTVSLVEEIAIQSKSQARGISEIHTDIQMVNTVTKKNSSDAKKTFSSAEYFYYQAEALRKMLSIEDEHLQNLLPENRASEDHNTENRSDHNSYFFIDEIKQPIPDPDELS
jgi:methyl-accepting chemotaxis protein